MADVPVLACAELTQILRLLAPAPPAPTSPPPPPAPPPDCWSTQMLQRMDPRG